ncbi:glucans biosynthesis glucosyltransferase MdoH [Pseudohongiella spirulinae]|uniref:Glucans biosynthesis glucosyltransferase H n=1 Tax=Pseudohongiella spirulinae TaxID=1249552 RepID=A0A0S2KCT6_9GAMM|nr:glucans biosynthesis glucosyltransferase MdoH [Pseudohongiella spirulinae]ALO45807.1 Glucosyltransferase MdoH [Pseudohongiella spirulinae]
MTGTSPLIPPPAPLSMPTQVLSSRPDARHSAPGMQTRLARLLTFGGSLLMTIFASGQMHGILFSELAGNPITVTVILWMLLALFSLTFGWIALTASAALAGLLCGHAVLRSVADAPLRGRTVLLMPIHNEVPSNASASLRAMAEDLQSRNLAHHFEIFLLSDTSDPAIWREEARTVRLLREQLDTIMPVWYRRRDRNTARKAGNIREFITRWGERYDYMVVLDADSLITADTLATLVREMDADSSAGILQTLPGIYGSQTLFARLQQFSGVIYGPVFARGLCAWQGDDGNYWGHNAILRVRAFAESAGLPQMPGPRPFGGEIRSHDFVEAALLRRAGWTVRMLPNLPGSWEECPPSLSDAAVRDRRWAQGNVQHLGVLSARGLRWPSRAHMLMGVMNYLMSPLWLAMVLIGLVLSAPIAAGVNALSFDFYSMLNLFLATLFLLFLPKILGLGRALLNSEISRTVGRKRLLLGFMVELLFSVLHAPIVMMQHTRHMWEIIRGQDSGWSAQQRRGTELQWQRMLRQHAGHTLLGLLMVVYLQWLSSPLLYWMLPMIIGLILSIPLSALSGSRLLADWLMARGLLLTPEEYSVPPVMERQRHLMKTVN